MHQKTILALTSIALLILPTINIAENIYASKNFTANVKTDKHDYSPGNIVKIIVTAKDSKNKPMDILAASIEVVGPATTVRSDSESDREGGHADKLQRDSNDQAGSGVVVFTFKLSSTASAGEYRVLAHVSVEGYEGGVANTTFNVNGPYQTATRN